MEDRAVCARADALLCLLLLLQGTEDKRERGGGQVPQTDPRLIHPQVTGCVPNVSSGEEQPAARSRAAYLTYPCYRLFFIWGSDGRVRTLNSSPSRGARAEVALRLTSAWLGTAGRAEDQRGA
ncbi:hypothetical protein H920_00019 [Fukomys damarensis]|uniref:Secreted protein n=1 Tax=Fukomys damarensis TaxID=885580 RepID=A0A091ES11_FUKDA|nr:hypothetical protein H920_00019 [Fukomys damarensis]